MDIRSVHHFGGEGFAFVDDGVIMVKSGDPRSGDPLELTEDEARRLARWLVAVADELDPPEVESLER